tara:strand:- start:89 stop:196 length:108 start_codon:yes stop_codon:yes gene_type:complete
MAYSLNSKTGKKQEQMCNSNSNRKREREKKEFQSS